ncbi:DUF1566 domain-containing protein [Hydrogenophaga sp. RWCD_12]|uniref:DUF1566 domain-containing protein n=1 Tax=Hydrogenophaga sp. RWCD_12 TaxID=3391190 RepID=UPI003984E0E3
MNIHLSSWNAALCSGCLVLLVACGGGKEADAPVEKSASGVGAAAAPKVTATIGVDNGRTPVYRFYNTRTGAHFYTVSATERDTVLSTLPHMTFEGAAFYASDRYSPGMSPVYRFYNSVTGVHFYTISEAEKNSIVASLPQFALEGTAYYASLFAGDGKTALYRFYVASRGFHFYTASAAESQSIQANLGNVYTYEGIGYHVLAADWQPWIAQLPHTGVTDQHCYAGVADELVSCGGSGAIGLNPLQDGHLTAQYPMVYANVPITPLINYPVSACVKDEVTGLMWEGKTNDGGARDQDNLYTNLGNNAASDISGYVAAVNAGALCGYRDWRLPSADELLTIVNYGRSDSPKIHSSWFPNALADLTWTGTLQPSDGTQAWAVDFGIGYSRRETRSNAHAVRLVRGARFSGQRFTVRSETYPGDATNNVVADEKTGLQWRRCLEGTAWTGSACTGSPLSYGHPFALSYAKNQTGWRLPNVRELATLMDRSQPLGSLLEPVAFPGGNGTTVWSSTPLVGDPQNARSVGFGNGYTSATLRTQLLQMRLVRDSRFQ